MPLKKTLRLLIAITLGCFALCALLVADPSSAGGYAGPYFLFFLGFVFVGMITGVLLALSLVICARRKVHPDYMVLILAGAAVLCAIFLFTQVWFGKG